MARQRKIHKNDMCNEFYIGQTERLLQICANEHQMPSRNTHVYQYITSCPTYLKQVNEFTLNYKNNFTSPQKAKVIFFKSRFSIIKKGFRNAKQSEILNFVLTNNISLNRLIVNIFYNPTLCSMFKISYYIL